jgi:acyl-CoA thioester hydrolase
MRRTVQAGEIDLLGHVNNAVYLHWVQDAAVAHWRALASPAMQAETLWVVVRHEIDYKAPAFEGDEVWVETWIGAATRATFQRHTEVFCVAGRELLARALTLWCPIDAEKRRPMRVRAEVRALFSVDER